MYPKTGKIKIVHTTARITKKPLLLRVRDTIVGQNLAAYFYFVS